MADLRFPERLLQPFQSLKQFQQELYAMFKPVRDPDGPEAAPPAGPAASEPASYGRPRFGVEGFAPPAAGSPAPGEDPGPPAWSSRPPRPPEASPRFRSETAEVTTRRVAASAPSRPPRRDRPAPPAPDEDGPRADFSPAGAPARTSWEARRPVREVPPPKAPEEYRPPPTGSTVAYVAPPPLLPPELPRRPLPKALAMEWPIPADPAIPTISAAGAGVSLGKVVSGTGATYQVTLYDDGPAGAPGDTVTVTVPTIDPSDTIPAGTWLAPIFSFSDGHYCQPPVWVA